MTSNKRYYWMKLFDSFFNEPRIKKLKRLPGGDTYIVITLKIMLQTIKTDGIYYFEGLENSLSEELELKIDEEAKHIQIVLDYLNSVNLIEKLDDNKYFLSQVQNCIGSETASTQRSRISRSNKKKMLQCNNTATKSNTEIEKELEEEKYNELNQLLLNKQLNKDKKKQLEKELNESSKKNEVDI